LALPQNEYEEGREVLAREICIEVIEQEKVRPIKRPVWLNHNDQKEVMI
jgi:hypothetical protein